MEIKHQDSDAVRLVNATHLSGKRSQNYYMKSILVDFSDWLNGWLWAYILNSNAVQCGPTRLCFVNPNTACHCVPCMCNMILATHGVSCPVSLPNKMIVVL